MVEGGRCLKIKQHILVYKGLPRDIYILFIATVINKIGGFIAPLMTLILTVKIGFSTTDAGLFSTISMLSQAPFIMWGGQLADKYGSKKVIVILQFLGAITYIVCGLMEPSFTLAIMLIVASNVYAMASPAFNAMVPVITPAPLVKNAYSLMYLGINLGLAVGPAIGGALFNNHLSLLFILNAAGTILSTVFILFFFSSKHKSDVPLPQTETEQTPVQSNKSDSIFFFLYQNPGLLVFSIIMLVFNFCYIQWTFLLPLQAVDIFKENGASVFSFLLSANAIIVILLTPVLTSLTQKAHPLKSIFIGGIFYFISYIMFAFNGFMATFIFAVVIMTIGEILISINTNNYIAIMTPKKYLGRAISILFVVTGAGYAIGPAVIGKIVELTSYTNAWFLIAAIMVGGIVSMYFVRRLEKACVVESLENFSAENIKEKSI